MDYQQKYLKYKLKYLELKKQIGGFDSETIILKEFIDENYSKLLTFPDYSIDEEKKEKYIMKYLDEDARHIVRTIVNNIKYISIAEFNEKVKELCEIYNTLKQSDDIYILVIPPQIVTGGGNTVQGDHNNIFRKSNFYVTLLSSKYLNYDHIIDISVLESTIDKLTMKKRVDTLTANALTTENMMSDDLINKLNNLNCLKDGGGIGKKINLFFCDDCSYSGTQIINFLNVMKTKYYSRELAQYFKKLPFNFKTRLILPYVLRRDILISLKQKCDIPSEIEACVVRNSSNVIKTNELFEREDIKNKIIILSKKYEEARGLSPSNAGSFFGTNYLLYFNFRYADLMSANQIVLAGQVIYGIGPVDESNLITNEHGLKYYPFIKNCDNKLNWINNNTPNCPYKLYDKIEYTFKGYKLNLHTLDVRLSYKLNEINQTINILYDKIKKINERIDNNKIDNGDKKIYDLIYDFNIKINDNSKKNYGSNYFINRQTKK